MIERSPGKTAVEILLIGVVFLVLASVWTWPMIADPAHNNMATPANNDARFNIYVIFWGAKSLVTDPLNIHHTNMFYPERYTFAYSDIEISHSLLMLPVILLFYNPVLTYNLLIISSIVLGGVGFYLLARDLTGHRAAAAMAAAIFVFNPAHFGRYTQIQFFGDFWLPWLAWALLRWLKGGGWGWALGSGILFCLHALSGSHNAVFGALLLGAAVIYYALSERLWRRARFWYGLIIILLTGIIVLLPIFWPYFIVEQKLSSHRVQDIDTLRAGSAGFKELVSSGSRFYRWLDVAFGWPSAMPGAPARGYLFPGIVAIALAFFGLLARREKQHSGCRWSRISAWVLDAVAIGSAWAALTLALTGCEWLFLFILPVPAPPAWILPVLALAAVGLRLSWFRKAEHLLVAFYRFLRANVRLTADQLFWILILLLSLLATLGPDGGLYHLIGRLPLVRMVRVPRRFVMVASFALAVLSAYGVAALARRIAGKGKRALALAIVIVIFMTESVFLPLRVNHWPNEPPEIYRWLGSQEGDFTVVEFPMDPTGYGIFARQIFYSIYHWKKMLVGYSGYQSEENRERLARLNASFPSGKCLDELQSLSVRYVVLLEGRMPKEKLEALKRQPRLRLAKRFGYTPVYELTPSAGE